ncbi:MAG: ABC transporter permease subunit [Planctomycetota bacterium]
MRETLAVFRREVKSLFVGPIPYLVIALFGGIACWYVVEKQLFFVLRQANLDPLFNFLPLLFAIFVPAIAMRMWSEEIRGETIEPLLTAPVRTRHVVIGKFLAGLLVVALCLLSTASLAVTTAALGDLDAGAVTGGYVGALLMGGAQLAVGLWLSSKTRNQIVAFLLGLLLCLAWTLVDSLGASAASGSAGAVLAELSFAGRFRSIAQGVFDLRDVAFFLSVIAFFLYLNVESIENRRNA